MPIEQPAVLRLGDIESTTLRQLLARYGIRLHRCAAGVPIPGSYWGEDEAGLKADGLYARADSPMHSILHEVCHYICLDPVRRQRLDTDAGSDDAEEQAVCYLQILLADEIHELGRQRMFADMDAWGYSFRLGSTRAWFEQDADDARAWLIKYGLVDTNGAPMFRLRMAVRLS